VVAIEVTDYTLTDALGVEHEFRERVVEAFRSMFVTREESLFAALQHADYRSYSGDDIPGCFAYLALTHQTKDQQIDRRGCEQRQRHCDQRLRAVRTWWVLIVRNIPRFYAASPPNNLLENSELVYDSVRGCQ
jgi:hypothetical protein